MKSRWLSLLQFLMALILFGGASSLILISATLSQQFFVESNHELNDRSLRLYFNQRFKQHDQTLSIQSFNEGTALVFRSEDMYIIIYEQDGQLIEQSSISLEIMAGAGQVIGHASDFTVQKIQTQWWIGYTNPQGENIELHYTLRSMESPS